MDRASPLVADSGAGTRKDPHLVYYAYPRLVAALDSWADIARDATQFGFRQICVPPLFRSDPGDPFLAVDHEAADPSFGTAGDADTLAARLAGLCGDPGIQLYVDVVLDRVAATSSLAREFDVAFDDKQPDLDPRRGWRAGRAVRRRDDDTAKRLSAWWVDRLKRLADRGVSGVRLIGAADVPTGMLRDIVLDLRRETDLRLLAWTPGADWKTVAQWSPLGLDGVFASTCWWDGRAPWFVEEHNLLAQVAPVIGVVEAPFEDRAAASGLPGNRPEAASHRRLEIAAATSDGLFVPMGFEGLARQRVDAASVPQEMPHRAEALASRIREHNLALGDCRRGGTLRSLSGPGSTVTRMIRTEQAGTVDSGPTAIVINTDDTEALAMPRGLDSYEAIAGDDAGEATEILWPGEVRVIGLRASASIRRKALRDTGDATAAAGQPRIVVDNLMPTVDRGAFPAKRIVGSRVVVEADIFADGHDRLAAELRWRATDEENWHTSPMQALGNDRWQAAFIPSRIGRYEMMVEAWWNEFETLHHAIEVKHASGIDIGVELTEARIYVDTLIASGSATAGGALRQLASALAAATPAQAVKVLGSPAAHAAVTASGSRPFRVRSAPIQLEVERTRAGFASWYELFPRSQTDSEARHGTFRDVIAALPRVRDMGFDVLYFPPIHPIGTTNRKGRNNSLVAGAHDVGSPYAIGSRDGGHDAIHPELGTFDDFKALLVAAHHHGLEIALDFAIQCSPDHPWLREHPDWFRRRPDGTIKYAENPPKKYEDIVNVDFYAEGAVPGLWRALRDIVLFWIEQGVTIFRVDNPHTKPLPFWQWLIADVRGRHPEAMFLAEAFTRPKMMNRLAKIGFSQSYTYFTWRNTKQEITDYLTELTTTEAAEFFRPHFFVNTPDINPYFLQTSGRAGFQIRAVLAATLSGLWGVYAGFEICEAAPLPGREEYLDSEKYQIRLPDPSADGNIVDDIVLFNRLRRAHPALQSHLGLTFYNAANDRILLYGKAAPEREDMILVAVSLDPLGPQEADFEVPLWEWNLPDNGSLAVDDLLTGKHFVWSGKVQHMRLDPAVRPFHLWRISPISGAAL